MNDKALYQLERAADALTLMAKYLREDQITFDNNVILSGNGFYGDEIHSKHWYDYNRNDVDRYDPFNINTSSSPDVITFS